MALTRDSRGFLYNTISMSKHFIDFLEANLVNSRGALAQDIMAPSGKHTMYRVYNELTVKKACVMALLYEGEDGWHILFIKRNSKNRNDKHKGQISFPGGKLEASDDSYLACALREVEEEIGVSPEEVHVVGTLTKLYVFVSQFLVYPFVGVLKAKPHFDIQEEEVDHVIEFKLNQLLDPSRAKIKDLDVRGFLLKNVPYYDLDGETLWGATAMITAELLDVVRHYTIK